MGRIFAALLLGGALLNAAAAPPSLPTLQVAAVERNPTSWVAAQLLAEVYREAGLRLKLLPMPGSRADVMAASGQVDGELIRIRAYGAQRPQLRRVDPPLYQVSLVAYSLPARAVQVHSRDDLKLYSVGVIRGVAASQEMTEGHPAVTATANAETLFDMLQLRRVDLVLDNRLAGNYRMARLGIKNLVASPDLARYEVYHYLHERHSALLPRLAQAIRKLKASGELDRLTAYYEAQVMLTDLDLWAEPPS